MGHDQIRKFFFGRIEDRNSPNMGINRINYGQDWLKQGPDLIDLRRPLEGIILLVLGSWILLAN